MKKLLGIVLAACLLASTAWALEWRTSWAASAHGPYPSGNALLQPELKFAFPDAKIGAVNQTFRMMVHPGIWGESTRIRFTNVFGSKPLTIDDAFVGLRLSSGAVVPGTSQPVTFGGQTAVTIPPGEYLWSDPVPLPFFKELGAKWLKGRDLAVSFHVVGESGPMTWHAKAVYTSYVTRPNAGSVGMNESESDFPYSSSSWYFIDAVDMLVSPETQVIVTVGDSITDGTGSTINGNDRWADVIARLLYEQYGDKYVVVNAAIGGNEIVWPKEYSPEDPFSGGPAFSVRVDRDVLSLSGVSAIIWFEGINDLSHPERTVEEIEDDIRRTIAHIKATAPEVRVIGATLTTAYGSHVGTHGSQAQDKKRRQLNEDIRHKNIFDAYVEFASITIEPKTGRLKPEFVPASTGGGGDLIHPNRAGYMTMGQAIEKAGIFK